MKHLFFSAKILFVSILLCCASSCKQMNEQKLLDAINEAKTELLKEGGDMGGGITFTDATLGTDDVVFTYTVDESVVTVADIKENTEATGAIRTEMINNLREGYHEDVEMKAMTDLCVECGRGILYKFVGNQSGDTFKVIVSSSELASFR